MEIGNYPTFSWSISRANKFEFCNRQYYYHYYGSWKGWEDQASERTKLIYILKNRKSLPAWKGSLIHSGISKFLSRQIHISDLIEQIKQRAYYEFDQSAKQEYLNPGMAKRAFGLIEHYYGEITSEKTLNETILDVETCLTQFSKTPFRNLIQDAKRCNFRVFIEPSDDRNLDLGKFLDNSIADCEIYAKPDFVFERPRNRLFVLDWKTGKPNIEFNTSEVSTQLSFYSMWVANKGLFDTNEKDKIFAYEYYLPSCTKIGAEVKPEFIDAAIKYCKDSIERMRAPLSDKINNWGEEKAFEAIPSINRCSYCNFRAVCEEYKKMIESADAF